MPGNEDGLAAEMSLDEAARTPGYVVSKRAAAPDSTVVLIELPGPPHRRLTVAVDGRARLVAELSKPPTIALRMPSSLFLRLYGGRVHVSEYSSVALDGDLTLAQSGLDNLAFTV